MKEVLIHSYMTDGMFELGKVFLKSLYKTSGDKFPVILTTRELTEKRIDELLDIYPNMEVHNGSFLYEDMAKAADISVSTLKAYKKEVESKHVTRKNKVWKLMVAAEDRPLSLYDLLFDQQVSVPIVHFDIDTLFRKDISPIIEEAHNHDCCLLLRLDHPNVKARITISTMTWKANQVNFDLFNRWIYYLNAVPPIQRPIGYGQTSLWLAYKDIGSKVDCHKLSNNWGYPGKHSNGSNNYVWSGAVHKLTKDDCAKLFNAELEGL